MENKTIYCIKIDWDTERTESINFDTFEEANREYQELYEQGLRLRAYEVIHGKICNMFTREDIDKGLN